MEVRKLYYEDSQLQSFTARVVSCEQSPKGWEITLDATAFYPEGGGQACDTGLLENVRVLEVRERGDRIVHLCDGPLTPGTTVAGWVDWDRRLDLAQQHTGEHILSGLIHQRFGYHNVGFHVGKVAMEVDFDGPIEPQALEELEAAANVAVWADVPLHCWTPDPEQLEKQTYRTKRPLPWPVRLVQIPGFDSCACCGVHVAHTGQVGLIKILSCVKFHGGVRLELVCGKRAYDYLCAIFRENRQVSQQLSAKPLQTAEAVEKLSSALAQEKLRANTLQDRLWDGIVREYAGLELAVRFEPELNSAQVRALADKLAQACGGTAVVFSGCDEAGYSLCVVSRTGLALEMGRRAAQALQGRGGGKPDAYQGFFRSEKAAILRFFQGNS